jgi:hypothetical protein
MRPVPSATRISQKFRSGSEFLTGPVNLSAGTARDDSFLTADRNSYFRYFEVGLSGFALADRWMGRFPHSPDLPRNLSLGSGVTVGGRPKGAGPMGPRLYLSASRWSTDE